MTDRPATTCPYCGGEARSVVPTSHAGTPGKVWMAHCRACHASGPWRDSPDGALSAWRSVARTPTPGIVFLD